MFVKNSWYVIAWSDEIGSTDPLARTIVGEQLVLYRTPQGKVVALDDRCAHRLLPLSLGRVTEDGRLICAYHGLTFDETGKCVHVPGSSVTPSLCVKSYPVEERAGLVWAWMGDPKLADPKKIIDCSLLEKPGWHTTRLYRHVEANYMLLNDNLADLLHVAFLHIPSGGGNENMGPAETELDIEGNSYHFVRETMDIPAPKSYQRLSNASGNVDRWHIADFVGPSFYRINTGVALAGTGGAESNLESGNGRWAIVPHHFITPETESTIHYFPVIAHEWQTSTDAHRFIASVIDEDIWAIEHQQKTLEAYPGAKPGAIHSDGPLFAMRKIVDNMLAQEAH